MGNAMMIAGLLLLLLGEVLGRPILQWIGKPLASLGFIVLGKDAPPAFVVAFVLSFVGDVLLLGKSKRALSAGILAFLSAHVAFVVAFVVRGVIPVPALIGFLLIAPISYLLARWVLRHASADMRSKVVAYVVVITLMVGVAAGTTPSLLVAACTFYASDICVARHRFVSPGSINRLIGLPLYYAAQWLFTWAA